MQDLARHMQTHQQGITASLPTGLDVDLLLMDSPLNIGAVTAKDIKKGIAAARKLIQIWKILSKVFMAVDVILDKKKYGNEITSRDLDNVIKALMPLQSLMPKSK